MSKSNFNDLDVKFAEKCRYTKHIDKFVINEYANYLAEFNHACFIQITIGLADNIEVRT